MRKPDSWFPENRPHNGHSKKYCCCGGHNHSNPKKNKHNHSTRNRLLIRLSRKYWKKQRENF